MIELGERSRLWDIWPTLSVSGRGTCALGVLDDVLLILNLTGGAQACGRRLPAAVFEGGSELSSRVREQGFDLVGHEVGDE